MPRTPYADWQDDLAWMDGMRGARWNAALYKEQRIFNSVTHIPAIKRRTSQFLKTVKEIERQQSAIQQQMTSLPAHIPKAIRDAENDFDIAADGTIVYLYAKDYGSQFLTIAALSADGRLRLWEKAGVHIGENVAILNDRCYYTLSATNNRNYAVESCDVATGENVKRHFEEADERKLVHLCKAERGALFFSVEDSDIYDLYDLPAEGKPRRIYSGAWFTVLGYANGNGNTTKPVVFISLKDGEQKLHNLEWPLPSIDNGYVTCGSIANGWLITNLSGVERLYKWGPSGVKLVLKIYGSFEVDMQRLWQGDRRTLIFAMQADDVPIRIVIEANGSIKQTPITTPLDQPSTVTERQTTSADGSRVNFLIVRGSNNNSSNNSKKPAGLLVYGYGSYGIPTSPDKAYTDYKPLIDAGWAIAFAFIRGGGDRDDAWAAAGRLYNRQRSIEDFEAVIRAARVATGVPPERTVITGRSAGGLLVGTVAARNPTGQLFAGIYAEVPFLDVLKTMHNRKYPRTTTEQNEFGDPMRSLTDFMVALEHSPVNRVADTGLPNIFVLARTAENDSQVFPYEPLKWIWRLREGSEMPKEGKLFAYAKGQGHFYVADAAETARSTDLAILHEWATNQAARKKIAVYSIKMGNGNNNVTMRKNRTERKQRKQEGGKRKASRKATGTRKASRKSSTRKSNARQRKH
jgi:hypothetical protein